MDIEDRQSCAALIGIMDDLFRAVVVVALHEQQIGLFIQARDRVVEILGKGVERSKKSLS